MGNNIQLQNQQFFQLTMFTEVVADLVKVLRNISEHVEEGERRTQVQLFMNRMQVSGYTLDERREVYRRAIERFNNMVKRDKDGIMPLYRSKNWNREMRDKEKSEKKAK